MAEEDDGRIRVLQSLRGKICKCGLYAFVFFPPRMLFSSGNGVGGEGGGGEAEPPEKGCRRGAAECGGRGGPSSVLCPGADLACYRHLSAALVGFFLPRIWRHMSSWVEYQSCICLLFILFICLFLVYVILAA